MRECVGVDVWMCEFVRVDVWMCEFVCVNVWVWMCGYGCVGMDVCMGAYIYRYGMYSTSVLSVQHIGIENIL